jgi:hypothetical protein
MNKNWFERHLNRTWVLGLVVATLLWLVFIVFVAVEEMEYGVVLSITFLRGITFWIVFVVMFPVSLWVLHRKGRSLLWVLLAHWGSPLWLSNRSEKEIMKGEEGQ